MEHWFVIEIIDVWILHEKPKCNCDKSCWNSFVRGKHDYYSNRHCQLCPADLFNVGMKQKREREKRTPHCWPISVNKIKNSSRKINPYSTRCVFNWLFNVNGGTFQGNLNIHLLFCGLNKSESENPIGIPAICCALCDQRTR